MSIYTQPAVEPCTQCARFDSCGPAHHRARAALIRQGLDCHHRAADPLPVRERMLVRAKRLSGQSDWVIGYYLHLNQEHYMLPVDATSYILRSMCRVDPATVCRYTGQHDSQGTPIFEGDILSHGPAIQTAQWCDDPCIPRLLVVGNIYTSPDKNKGGTYIVK